MNLLYCNQWLYNKTTCILSFCPKEGKKIEGFRVQTLISSPVIYIHKYWPSLPRDSAGFAGFLSCSKRDLRVYPEYTGYSTKPKCWVILGVVETIGFCSVSLISKYFITCPCGKGYNTHSKIEVVN